MCPARGVSDEYGVKDAACPISTRGGGGGGEAHLPSHSQAREQVFTPEELGVSPQIFFKITLSEVVAQLTHEERGRNKRSDGAHYTLEQKGDVVFQSSNAAGGEEKVPRLSGGLRPSQAVLFCAHNCRRRRRFLSRCW